MLLCVPLPISGRPGRADDEVRLHDLAGPVITHRLFIGVADLVAVRAMNCVEAAHEAGESLRGALPGPRRPTECDCRPCRKRVLVLTSSMSFAFLIHERMGSVKIRSSRCPNARRPHCRATLSRDAFRSPSAPLRRSRTSLARLSSSAISSFSCLPAAVSASHGSCEYRFVNDEHATLSSSAAVRRIRQLRTLDRNTRSHERLVLIANDRGRGGTLLWRPSVPSASRLTLRCRLSWSRPHPVAPASVPRARGARCDRSRSRPLDRRDDRGAQVPAIPALPNCRRGSITCFGAAFGRAGRARTDSRVKTPCELSLIREKRI